MLADVIDIEFGFKHLTINTLYPICDDDLITKMIVLKSLSSLFPKQYSEQLDNLRYKYSDISYYLLV